MKRLLLLLLLPFTLASAADPPRKIDPFAGLLAAPDQLVKARDQLGLGDDQQKRLREIHETNYSDYRKKTAEVADAQRALSAALEKQPVNEADAHTCFAALLAAERAVKELEFRVLVAARAVLTVEQATKMRSLQSGGASSVSAPSREDAVKVKLERLQQLIKERERAGQPPREREETIRELERVVREKNVEKAEPLVDELLRALGETPSGAAVNPTRVVERRLHVALREAMQRKDVAAVEQVVGEWRAVAGASLAEPEEPVKPERPAEEAKELTESMLSGAFAPMLARIERSKFWNIGLDPRELGQFPRGVGSVVIGTLAARRAGCAEPERLLKVAREAGDFLVWAQDQGGVGVFPMPARRNGEGKVWGIVERGLRNAEEQGRYAEIVHNGWCVEDAGIGDDGGLQIENAVCGIGVLHLYEATQEEQYLRSAKASGDWAIKRSCVTNWNYNSFSVWLLAELHRVTGEARYLEAAREKTNLGVLPGQLTDGPRAGRWLDPHNARPNYHYILTRALACLLPRLAENDPDRAPVARALRRALLAWNPTFPRDGAPNISSASEALALLELRLPNHAQVLGDTGMSPALRTLERLGTTALAAGMPPGDPSSWGLLIEAAAKRGPRRTAATARPHGELPLVTNDRDR